MSRRRASLREGPLAELFRATEGGRRLKRRRSLRGPPGMSSLTLIAPVPTAIALVGIIAVAALVLSVWQLARSDGAQLAETTATAAGVEAITSAGVTGSTQAVATTLSLGEKPEQVAEPTPSPAEKPKPVPAMLVLTAARGDCWLEVRVGSATGKLLFAGTLERGRSLRFVKRRLWLAFGAGGNLEVRVNGRRLESFPTGTASVIVTAAGLSRPVSS